MNAPWTPSGSGVKSSMKLSGLVELGAAFTRLGVLPLEPFVLCVAAVLWLLSDSDCRDLGQRPAGSGPCPHRFPSACESQGGPCFL